MILVYMIWNKCPYSAVPLEQVVIDAKDITLIKTFLNVGHFDCTTDTGSWKVWSLNLPLTHTGWMIVVAPTDRPKSVRNRCVVERFCSVFVLLWLCIVCRLGVFVIRMRQISSLLSVSSRLAKWKVATYLGVTVHRWIVVVHSCVGHWHDKVEWR